jgi:adenine-specific DNA-methyltransferase
MKGFVPTPEHVVDQMVAKLFGPEGPKRDSTLLDPGCGNGDFLLGVLRACRREGWQPPRMTGIELSPERAACARAHLHDAGEVTILTQDFLQRQLTRYDYIIGNPPYVSIQQLSPAERLRYRREYQTAKGRFDLYLLFFEEALRLLAPGGRLVFITPEKFLYVETARPLRELLLKFQVEDFHFTDEAAFPEHIAYPLISTVVAAPPTQATRVRDRSGQSRETHLKGAGTWQPQVNGFGHVGTGVTLADVTTRISCGVATGADGVFVMKQRDLPEALRPFAHLTLSGRQVRQVARQECDAVLVAPYSSSGIPLPESALGALGAYLRLPENHARLTARTCTAYKPWYAFHDNFPLLDMQRPKLLCKDITSRPFFVPDSDGRIVPRHSVYYIVPRRPDDLEALMEYLNSVIAREWLEAHCQRAANGFLRLQSHVLKRLPIPPSLGASVGDEQVELLADAALVPA